MLNLWLIVLVVAGTFWVIGYKYGCDNGMRCARHMLTHITKQDDGMTGTVVAIRGDRHAGVQYVIVGVSRVAVLIVRDTSVAGGPLEVGVPILIRGNKIHRLDVNRLLTERLA